jgi:predicted site-specific integrase-resolvase
MESKNFLSIGKASAMIGVCTKTLRRWDKAGKFVSSFRTGGGHRRYDRRQILEYIQQDVKSCGIHGKSLAGTRCTKRAAVYGRVSASRQRKSGDLDRQLSLIHVFCQDKGYKVVKIYSDVGSGLNDTRRGLLRLLRDASLGIIDVVVVNYTDRLARFGLNVIREYLTSWGVRLEVVHPTLIDSSPHAELITDLTSILYSFMGKLYRLRRNT